MPQFPIRYSQAVPPPGQTSVRANLDTDTGAGMIGRALEGAGGALAEIGMKIRDAQDSTALDTFRRQYVESKNALQKTFDVSRDAEANQVALDAFVKQWSSYQHSNPRVNQAAQHFLATTLPEDQGRFDWFNLKIRRENVETESRLNEDSMLLRGDLDGYAQIQWKKKALGIASQEEVETNIASAPAMSVVAQIGDALNDDDLTRATRLVEQAKKMNLTPEQKEHVAKVGEAIDRAAKERAGQAQIEYLVAADKAASLSALERHAEIERLKPLIAQYYRTPGEARESINWLNSIDKSEAATKDPMAEIQADQAIRTLNADSTPQEKAAVRDRIMALSSQLGLDTVKYIKELDNRLDGEKTKAVEYAVAEAVARNRIDKSYAPILRRDLESWINAQKGDVEPSAIIKRGAELAVMVPPTAMQKEEAPVFSQTKIQPLLGTLLNKNLTDKTAAGAVKYITEELGPDWAKHAPRALEIILDTYPDAKKTLPLEWRMRQKSIPTDWGNRPYYVKTDADYDALPSGAEFIDPNGVKRRKP